MQILLDIPDEDVPNKQEIMDISLHFIEGEVCECSYPYIVLPKGHGRLIDVDVLTTSLEEYRITAYSEYDEGRNQMLAWICEDILDAPTIIEADTEKKI